ncbi:hypothetical protein [Anaeromyxobacter oryzisoli]|uniref:hypothetical protein n=1 Tax=Anaeromyxobacter oryzisoli TaxID=2925408 RepID=UPI001F5833CD|nr:hypothetical protein [Anaeromyxobacter sp. SG63]
MRRLALLLAAFASVLGMGCVTTTECDHTVSISWSSFLLANGNAASCSGAGVTSVAVYMNNQPVKTVPCSDGGMSVVGVPGGTQQFTVEGLDANGTIVVRDELAVDASVCGEQLVDAQPAEGVFTLAYSFQNNGSCSAPSSQIVYSILDQTTGLVADYQSLCGDVISFALPTGPYVLRRIEELDSTGTVVYASYCAATSFTVGAGTPSTLGIVIPDSQTFCPASATATPSPRPAAKALSPAVTK